MKLRILSVFAAVALLAACESAPDDSASKASAGTPAGIVAGSEQDFVANVGDRVYFDYDKYTLSAEAKGVLTRQAAWLKQYPNYALTVEGHADERGTREYNLALGERRANSTKEFLVAQGVPAARVKTISYGKERPVALGANDTAWAQNRRGVTVLAK